MLVTPLWETQPWFPVVMSMLVDLPILPNIPDVLKPSPNCDSPVVETQAQLVTWKVSGNTSNQRRFQAMLSTSSCLPGGAKRTLTITLPEWEEWCKQKSMHHFSADVSSTLGFLADQFEEGKQYRSLNSASSKLTPQPRGVNGGLCFMQMNLFW